MHLDDLPYKKKIIIEALVKEFKLKNGNLSIRVQESKPVYVEIKLGFKFNYKEFGDLEKFGK